MKRGRKKTRTKEERLAYQRDYYARNAEKLRAQYYQQVEEAKSRPKSNSTLEMLQNWNIKLQERIEQEDLESWLRWSLQLTVNENNKQIEQITNGGKNEGHTSEKD